MQFEHSLGLGGEPPLRDVHYLHSASLTVRSLSTLVTLQCNPNNVLVIAVRAHCSPLDIFLIDYILLK